MPNRRAFLAGGLSLTASLMLAPSVFAASEKPTTLRLSDEAWRARLPRDRYEILRRAGTEPPYSSPLNDEHRAGVFSCAGCDLALFSSHAKFDSGTGWPSFYRALPHAVREVADRSLPGPARTEVRCARCEGHLGHVFDDGPKPTGLRYCMNGLAMRFTPRVAGR